MIFQRGKSKPYYYTQPIKDISNYIRDLVYMSHDLLILKIDHQENNVLDAE